jgi:hypothetical protein
MINRVIGMVRKRLNPATHVSAIIITRWENSKLYREIEARLRSKFGDLVYRSKIRKIRTIATREGLQIKDVIGAAFTKAVRSYERKHGPIEGDGKTNLKDLF